MIIISNNNNNNNNNNNSNNNNKEKSISCGDELAPGWTIGRRKAKRRLPSTLLCDGSLSNSIPNEIMNI